VREYRPIYGPVDAGLDRFVAHGKEADFVGKAAAAAARAAGGSWRLRQFTVAAEDADAIGDEPIFLDGKACGWVTSGGFGHRSGRSVALGYVPKEVAEEAGPWEIEILGRRLAAEPQARPVYDPEGLRMRG
jgi:dimethylglycine dehydrogenase